jgi:hypothetical protein
LIRKPEGKNHLENLGVDRRIISICILQKSGGRAWTGRKEPFGRPRRRWENNIKMDLKEIGWEGVAWIDLAQDRDK